MAKSPEEMTASMIQNMPEKTGKGMDEWLKIAKKANLEKHGQLVKHLKSEHAMTHGFANLVAITYFQQSQVPASGGDLVSEQYSGEKAALKSVYDAIIDRITKFGDDVEISPKKTYVSLRRNKQFAIVQPSTKTRIDVGINLKGMTSTERLETSGSFNQMVSHRVRLSNKDEVDNQLLGWLKQAYKAS
jgi:predicted transport protein